MARFANAITRTSGIVVCWGDSLADAATRLVKLASFKADADAERTHIAGLTTAASVAAKAATATAAVATTTTTVAAALAATTATRAVPSSSQLLASCRTCGIAYLAMWPCSPQR